MAWKTENERMEYAEKAGNISKKIAEILKMETGTIITDSIRNSLKDYQAEADFLKNKLEKNEFEIAIVGLEKAGKSSFSNAIMEKNILPTEDGRCTYTATCIRYSNEDKANVKFYGQDEFDKDFVDKLDKVGIENAADYSYQTISLDTYEALYEKRQEGSRYDETLNEDIRNIIQKKDELSKYLGMPERVFKGNELTDEEFLGFIKNPGQAIAVKEVNIHSKELDRMRNAVIYDVPGFNSPTEMHKKQTLGKMDHADAIVMVAKGDEPSLTGDVLQIFRQSDKDGNQLKEKLFVFANKSDRATKFSLNQEKTYEEWTKRYPYVESKDKDKRIVFGSANAHLQSCGVLDGENFIRSVEDKGLPDGDGIERIKTVLEEYNQTQRAEVLKTRIRRLQEDVKKLFSETSEYKDIETQEEMDARNNLAVGLYAAARDGIPKSLDKLNSQIKNDMGNRPLSNNICEKVKALISLENYTIQDEEITELHNKYAGVGNSDEISRVENKIRENRFYQMYHEFSREIVDMALAKHEEYENEIIEVSAEALGVKAGAVTEEKVKRELRKLFEEAEIIKEKGDYYQGLVERFSRDIYEILINTPYNEERSKRFYDSKDNFYSMSIFYRGDEKEELSINQKVADLPMCRLLLFHTHKKEKENVIAAYEKIKEFVGNNEEIFELLKILGKATPLHIIEIAAEICKEIAGEADGDARVSLASTLLKRKCQMSSELYGTTSIADTAQFQEQYRRFHAERGNRDYDMIKQDFADDVEILCDVLQNAFVNAIDIEKTFVAKEQKIIEDIRMFVKEEEAFQRFVVKNLYLIKHQECSDIREKEKRERLNQVCMERIRELLTELN